MKNVMSISLKLGSDGKIFAAVDLNPGVLRIFDIRRSTSGELKFNSKCYIINWIVIVTSFDFI